MAVDLRQLGTKLRRYREQLALRVEEVATATAIETGTLRQIEEGNLEPTGDQILMLSDCYRCDYKVFISNDKISTLDETEKLFRSHSKEFSRSDRMLVQEFLYVCECEEQLVVALGKTRVSDFTFTPKGSFRKQQGRDAAAELRAYLNYGPRHIPEDMFAVFRGLGIHIFRRPMENSNISGLLINHPVAGRCVLVNYTEDVYRQRFTVAHEGGHAVIDGNTEYVVSIEPSAGQQGHDLVEVRANAFASNFLLPREALLEIPRVHLRSVNDMRTWAHRLQVNPPTLAIALQEAGIINGPEKEALMGMRIPRTLKTDAEVNANLAVGDKRRQAELLRRGLSRYYVKLCYDAYDARHITAGRLSEMLLLSPKELEEFTHIVGKALHHGD